MGTNTNRSAKSRRKDNPRREAAEQVRRADERRQRRRTVLIYSAVAIVAVAIIGGAALGVRSERQAASAPIDGVVEVENQEANHVPEAIVATELPPTGGNHSVTVQNCGVYDTPVAAENAVHSLEHGAVWLSYRPDLAEQEVTRLRDLAKGQTYMIVSPFPDQASPIVATAWGRQLEVADTGDPRLERFIKRFVQGKQAPEPGAPCSGGTGSPI